jgi:4-diphosphocytidyl-2-C-methyl-D-erythritol kinase
MLQSRGWPAPAKLNLMLRVVGRRADGYHELQTVFQFLQHQDLLHITPLPSPEIQLDTPLADVPMEQNLIFRAARLLQQESGCGLGARIILEKQIPMGGGLGGGSSDAATTLAALNRLWDTGLNPQELARLGLSLGADVPVFIHGHAAWAEGIGEHLTDLAPPESWYLVLTPACHVSTADIFAAPNLTRNSPRIRIRDFLQGDCANDCLPVVRERHPEVAVALDWLQRHAAARLTGTGACVFAGFPSEDEARRVHGLLPKEISGFVSKGLNRSPLLDRIHAT